MGHIEIHLKVCTKKYYSSVLSENVCYSDQSEMVSFVLVIISKTQNVYGSMVGYNFVCGSSVLHCWFVLYSSGSLLVSLLGIISFKASQIVFGLNVP